MRAYLEALWANRYTTALVAVLVLAAGIVAFKALPRSVFPNVNFPRISVLVSDGYLPVHVMLVRVTEPLEQAAKGVPNVTLVRSTTSNGLSKIHVFFNSAITPNDAYLLLEARLGQVALPPGAHMSVRLMMPSIYPFAEYALVSQTRTSSAMMPTYAFTVKPRLLDVPGVYTVASIGRGWPQVHVDLSLRRLISHHLGLARVVALLRAHQGPYFGGVAADFHDSFLLTAAGRPASVAALARLPVPLGGARGAVVPLSALARVSVGPPPRVRGSAVAHHAHSLLIEVAAQASANVEGVARGVAGAIASLRKGLPHGMRLVRDYDLSRLIAASLRDVWMALFLGTVITFAVLLAFLRRFDTALATLIVVPLSLAGTFVILHILHLGLNIMTLGGITAAIGALVDHAIVVIEQATHSHAPGTMAERRSRALRAAGEVLPMMTFATLTSALVFVPLILLTGTIGILFRQMAIALVTALVVSQAVALSVTPLLATYLAGRGRLPPKAWRPARRARVAYARVLRRGLKRPMVGVFASLAILACAYGIFRMLPTAFLPAWDEGVIAVPFRTAVGSSASQTLAIGRGLVAIAARDPAVATASVVVGQSLGNPRATPNKGDLVITLKPQAQTVPTMRVLGARFRAAYPSLSMLKLHQLLVTQLGNLSGAHSPLDVEVFGHSATALAVYAGRLKARLAASHRFANVSFPTSSAGPEIALTPRTRAQLRGLTPPLLGEQILAGYWGVPAGYLLHGAQILPIAVSTSPAGGITGRLDPRLFVHAPHGPYAPLAAFARARMRRSVPVITHQNLVPFADIEIRPHRAMGLSQAAAVARSLIAKTPLPHGITARIAGYYKEQAKSFAQMEITLVFALLVLLVLVGYQLRTQRAALAVLVATALSTLGSLAALWLRGIPLDSTSFLGLLLVFAIAVNNGILIFGQARHYRSPPGRIEVELAARRRLRPILMTMAADVLGFLPLAVGVGHGTDLLKPLATAVMGGLVLALGASLFIGPMLYVAFSRRPRP
ncbi:efflux RND transporter permease subunit [Acidiphilium sp.]|uniref:efflux RND transporter permease subunit n=1 Tax=Acidiphilium sp. TaxID=527 RepID=UPI002584026B|nr:efflux RND transporter permease subunit [Acidiphilium sp.]